MAGSADQNLQPRQARGVYGHWSHGDRHFGHQHHGTAERSASLLLPSCVHHGNRGRCHAWRNASRSMGAGSCAWAWEGDRVTLLAAPSRPSAVPRPENSHSGTGSIRIRVAVNAISELTPKFGSQVYLRELLDELGRMEDIELCILVRAKEREALEQNWRIRRLEVPVPATASYWQVLVQPLIQWRLRRADVQVYHLPNTLPLFRKSVPTVVTIHDLADLRVRKYGHVRTLYRWLINYLSAHLADAVITVSHNSKHDITKLLHVPEHKVAVIYNGVGQAFRPLDRAACIRSEE